MTDQYTDAICIIDPCTDAITSCRETTILSYPSTSLLTHDLKYVLFFNAQGVLLKKVRLRNMSLRRAKARHRELLIKYCNVVFVDCVVSSAHVDLSAHIYPSLTSQITQSGDISNDA